MELTMACFANKQAGWTYQTIQSSCEKYEKCTSYARIFPMTPPALTRVHLLESSMICADETVMQVLEEDDNSVESESRMWIYNSPQQNWSFDRLC